MANKKTTKNNTNNTLQSKFTLYNFAGVAKGYYLVDKVPFKPRTEDQGKPNIAHSIMIIDRSGSMYYDIEALKENLIKLLTLEEYNNSQLIVSLISYSSQRDVICHFQRVPITEIMKSDSVYLQEIKKIRVTGCTCISQSLSLAKTLIKEFTIGEPDEITAITLHTDGYANDPSYRSELNSLENICNELKTLNVFVNTISYSSADFQLLARIANTFSGSCLQAGNIREVYDALYQTNSLLNGSVSPPIEEPLSREYNYQVFVSKTAQKINGFAGTLKIMGLKPDDEGTFYKYREISADEYKKFKDVPTLQTDESVFAFVQANLAEGNLNTAKYALISTLDETLIKQHTKALTNHQLAEFSAVISEIIFNPSLLSSHTILSEITPNEQTSLLELLELLEANRQHIIVNLPYLKENYKRRGLKRINGSRDENRQLIEPWLKAEPIDGDLWVQMGRFDVNQNTATINLLITRPVKLVTVKDGEQITEIAGILVNNLNQYNNYTVVSDGELNLPRLKVKISNQAVFEMLKKQGNLTNEDGSEVDTFDFHSEYIIDFTTLPLVSFNSHYDNLEGIFEEIAQLQILKSILTAHIRESSDIFTPEQLNELKKHYLSKSLYLNFPTTTEYLDLQEALNQGIVDSRVSYKIDLGNRDILNLDKLHSANKFLERIYEAKDEETGEKIEKPTFSLALEKLLVFSHKKLSSRTKLTKVDDLMRPVFDNFLGLENNGTVAEILEKVGGNNLLRILKAKWQGEEVSQQEYVQALTETKSKLESEIEKIYRQKISPLVFYIGSTGLFPDELNTKAMTAEEINSKYPELKISKDEQEGLFFELGKMIITVYPKNEYYSLSQLDEI